MKMINCITLVMLLFSILQGSPTAQAQVNERIDVEAYLPVFDLEVTHSKTTSLIFPEEVISADVGSIGLLAEKFEKAANVIRVKANKPNFEETSLTIVTGDSRVWTYVVRYTDKPKYLSVDMRNAGKALVRPPLSQAQSSLYPVDWSSSPVDSTTTPYVVILEDTQLDPATIKLLTSRSSRQSRHIRDLGVTKYRMDFVVRNIFIRKNLMFFQFSLKNRTHIDYEIGMINIMVRDVARGKRTSVQEIEYDRINSDLKANIIEGKSSEDFTYAMPKITIPDKKEVLVQLFEKNGGRHVEFTITNRDLNQALPI